jgi:hypothetical protein
MRPEIKTKGQQGTRAKKVMKPSNHSTFRAEFGQVEGGQMPPPSYRPADTFLPGVLGIVLGILF